jgi:hypothetical protein
VSGNESKITLNYPYPVIIGIRLLATEPVRKVIFRQSYPIEF